VAKFTPEGADIDSVFDAKVVYQQHYEDIDIAQVPRLFRPKVGRFQVTDYEKIYSAISDDDIFDLREVDRSGALIIQRPDMYVAHILPLSAREEITEFFAQHMVPQRAEASALATAPA
jgi:phenol 2-monooxygenase (NADPH)